MSLRSSTGSVNSRLGRRCAGGEGERRLADDAALDVAGADDAGRRRGAASRRMTGTVSASAVPTGGFRPTRSALLSA